MYRFPHNRESYIPDGAQAVPADGTDAAIYIYEGDSAPYAITFHGRAQKPDWHYRFRNFAHRAARVAAFFDSRRSRAAINAEYKAQRTKPRNLAVGDILCATWGYDQTNVDFYQVTALIGRASVEIHNIAGRSENTGDMTGQCWPARDAFIGDPMRKRVSHGNSVKIRHQHATKCDPSQKHYWSSYA